MLGIIGFIAMPSTIDEFNSFCSGTDTVLTYGNAEAYYRAIAPKVRSKFLDAVEKLTGIKPRVVSTKKAVKEGGEDINVYEKDTSYIKHVLASGFSKEQLQPLLQKAFDDVGWDLTSSRVTGPNAKDKAKATAILETIANGGGTFAGTKAKIESLNPGLVIELDEDGTFDEETLADAIRIDRVRREASVDDLAG